MSEKSKVSVGRKVAYGFGSIAYGVKNNGFDYFFLIFFSLLPYKIINQMRLNWRPSRRINCNCNTWCFF